MSARAASSAEMLAAVERWARATGRWWVLTEHLGDTMPPIGWTVEGRSWAVMIRSFDGKSITRREVDPHTTLLWACTVETTETLTSPPMPSEPEARAWAAARVMGGRMEILRPSGVSARRPGELREFAARVTRPLAVDVGKCPACVARSLPGRKLATMEWGMATAYGRTKPYIAHARYNPADGWLRGWGGKRRKGSSQWAQHHARACPDCNGTGRDIREVARLVLDAAPRPWSEAPEMTFDSSATPGDTIDDVVVTRPDGTREAWCPGDPKARDRLAVIADQLQAAGERLGTWHALGLAGKDDAVGEMAAWLSERTPVVNSYAG